MSRKVRILIADNSKDFVCFLVQFLSAQPEVEVIGVAYNGQQAVQMVRQTNPDVLLLDIVMPDMDGIQALKEIRNENTDLKVIAMSAIDVTELIDTEKFGIKAYFIKPFHFENILHAIRS